MVLLHVLSVGMDIQLAFVVSKILRGNLYVYKAEARSILEVLLVVKNKGRRCIQGKDNAVVS